MKKNLFLILFGVILCASAHAQASFKYAITKKSAKFITITFTGNVEKNWHADVAVSFEECTGIKPEGELKKVGTNTYVQTLRIQSKHFLTRGYLRYICCNDKECLAPKYLDFSYSSTKKISKTSKKSAAKK